MIIKAEKIKKVVIIFENGLGDQILVLPTIRYLFSVFGKKMTLVCGKASLSSHFFEEIKFKKKIPVNFYDIENGIRNFDAKEVFSQIQGCDLLIHPCLWKSEPEQGIQQLVSLLGQIPTIGFYDFFSYQIPIIPNFHISDVIFSITSVFSNTETIESFAKPITFRSHTIKQIAKIRQTIPLQNTIITFQIETKPDKVWDFQKFNQLFEAIIVDNPDTSIFIVGSTHKDLAKYDFQNKNISYIGLDGNQIELSCAVVSISDYFIGIDSVFLHVADICRIPTLGIFGPSSYIRYGCRFTKSKHIGSSDRKMSSIASNLVFDTFKKL